MFQCAFLVLYKGETAGWVACGAYFINGRNTPQFAEQLSHMLPLGLELLRLDTIIK